MLQTKSFLIHNPSGTCLKGNLQRELAYSPNVPSSDAQWDLQTLYLLPYLCFSESFIQISICWHEVTFSSFQQRRSINGILAYNLIHLLSFSFYYLLGDNNIFLYSKHTGENVCSKKGLSFRVVLACFDTMKLIIESSCCLSLPLSLPPNWIIARVGIDSTGKLSVSFFYFPKP